MQEERFTKFTYIHDIATVFSVILSAVYVIKGTGSKIRDCILGSFLVMQMFALLKVAARLLKKKSDLQKALEMLYFRFTKEGKEEWKSSLLIYTIVISSVFFKIGVPLFLGKDD